MKRIKYPRTPHLPWSHGATSDDLHLGDCACFADKLVVVTEKMDGENTTIYQDGLHARSLDSRDHWSRSWVKAFHAAIRHIIPPNTRLCGENLYATHSIHYTGLKSFFYLFGIWTEDYCWCWNDTVAFALNNGIEMQPLLYDGAFDEQAIKNIDISDIEGYVVRVHDGFRINDFGRSVAKCVRKNHVQTNQHWFFSSTQKNTLSK
jgi:hypothetical protein